MTTSDETIRVLYVDDPEFLDAAATTLERRDGRLSVETATSVGAGLDRLADGGVDCVVAGSEVAGRDGLEFLETARERWPDLPFVLWADEGAETAEEAVSRGVTAYVRKGADGGDAVLANRITGAVARRRAERELAADESRPDGAGSVERSSDPGPWERRYRAMFDDPNVLFGLLDADGTVRDVNGAAREYVGAAREDVVGVPLSETPWTDPAARTAVERLVDHAASGEYAEFETEFEGLDGESYTVEGVFRPVRDDDGEVVSIIVSGRDITDRKRRERRLRETTARLEALFEHSPNMINVHDAEGNIIDPNRPLREKTGYAEAELTDMKVWDLDMSVDPDELRRVWREMDVGDHLEVEGEYRRRDGSTFPVEVHARRLDLEGEDRFVVISRDITEQRERERKLRRERDRLEEFAGVVSHDLRNPLQVAAGRVDLARRECESEHLGRAEDALDRMADIIDDVLWLASEGREIGETEPVDLWAAVERAWAVASDGRARAELVGPSGAGRALGTVEADAGRLSQLLENLFRNALEHAGDEVTVRVGSTDDGFYVEDDGPGVPPDERERVFDVGYSTDGNGTGFGLNIVERIAEAHGWTVRVTEGTDGGARVVVGDVAGESPGRDAGTDRCRHR